MPLILPRHNARVLQQAAPAAAPLQTAAAAAATAAANQVHLFFSGTHRMALVPGAIYTNSMLNFLNLGPHQVDYRQPLFLIGGSSRLRGNGGTANDLQLSSPDLRVNDHPTQFFKILFGGPTRDVNPLRLFSISGARRWAAMWHDACALAGTQGADSIITINVGTLLAGRRIVAAQVLLQEHIC